MTKPFSLSKSERLKSKKDIDTLFLSGKAFFVFPFKVFYRFIENEAVGEPLLFGVTVPKKIFRRAVDRNAIKRKVRELYRVNKPELKTMLSAQHRTLHIMLVYVDKTNMSSKDMQPLLINVLKKVHQLSAEPLI
jgi:ribonuclease P protein component